MPDFYLEDEWRYSYSYRETADYGENKNNVNPLLKIGISIGVLKAKSSPKKGQSPFFLYPIVVRVTADYAARHYLEKTVRRLCDFLNLKVLSYDQLQPIMDVASAHELVCEAARNVKKENERVIKESGAMIKEVLELLNRHKANKVDHDTLDAN